MRRWQAARSAAGAGHCWGRQLLGDLSGDLSAPPQSINQSITCEDGGVVQQHTAAEEAALRQEGRGRAGRFDV